MGDSGESHINSALLRNAVSESYNLVKDRFGPAGTSFAVLIGLIMPLFFSLMMVKKKVKQRGVQVTDVGGQGDLIMRNHRFPTLVKFPWEGATSIPVLFEQACQKYAQNRFLGSRRVINREVTKSGDGRTFEKLHLSEYEWESYREVFERVCNFASGLIKLGHDVDSRAAIFAETRPEWLIALQGCLRQNITVVTIYSSLGEDALIHSLNETQVSTLICDSKLLKKVASISSSLETVKHIVYIDDDGITVDSEFLIDSSHLTVSSFSKVEKLGKDSPTQPRIPSSSDIAVIMYTSGSTGVPKGVMMSHGNIVATAAAVMTIVPNLGGNDIYLAYLPLAHVLELEAEIVMLVAGVAIGYGSSFTLTDSSNKIKKGTKGDASVLKPTLMVSVPAILDRVREGVWKKVHEKGGIARKLFDIAYKRRLAAVEGSWLGAWGVEKVFWDVLVFNKVRGLLGGHIRFMLCGGAPLSRDTQRFINICIGAPIGQGYGLTETCAAATFSEVDDTSVGRVGPPLPCCYIKLVSWEEGGYMTSDKPMPRGEVAVGGFCVTQGYFKNEVKTNEVYKIDEGGTRWFYTGDVGQFHPDGCLEIIDRKKDIVKLQHGEYISLGKIEAALISSKYADNIMVYADPFHSYCVALVVLSHHAVEGWAHSSGIDYKDVTDLCEKEEVLREVQQSLFKAAEEAKLNKFEIPSKIKLLSDSWTPESGLVTAALKLKREQLKTKFKDELTKLYN